MLQATCDNPDKTCHHRYYAKYNQIFHFTSFFALVMKWEPALSSGPRVHYSLDTDVPSDRNCSPRARRYRALVTRQTERPSTSVWLFRFRLLTTESVSLNHSRCFQKYGVSWCHDWAFVGFCFAKIAWQFALHTRDGCCFREGFCKCM